MKTRLLSLFVIAICCAASMGCNANVTGAGSAQSSSDNNYANSEHDTAGIEMQEFKDIKAKADKGDIESQCWLAICYSMNLYGCKIDQPQAQELFEKVAKHADDNLAIVQFSKGVCYGIDNNYDEGAKWYRKAAEQEFAPAQLSLSIYYLNEGIGVPQSHENAVKWLRKSADHGFAPAQYLLGINYQILDKPSLSERARWIRLAAEQGLAPAEMAMGMCFERGDGVEQNYSEAVRWYDLAAKHGLDEASNPQIASRRIIEENKPEFKDINNIKAKAEKGDIVAQGWLAICYELGLYGCNIDEARSQELFQEVAKHANEELAVVQYAKARCYLSSRPPILPIPSPREYDKRPSLERSFEIEKIEMYREWIFKAMEQQFAPAQTQHGLFLHANFPDDDECEEHAVNLYRRAAEQGYAPAQALLGDRYLNGIGVPQNDDEAVKWFRKAAEQGLGIARISLGFCYYEGKVVPQNNLEALKYFYLAILQMWCDEMVHAKILGKTNQIFAELGENDIDEFIKWVQHRSGEKSFDNLLGAGFLMLSVLNNQTAVVKKLAELGADVNQSDLRHHSEYSMGSVYRSSLDVYQLDRLTNRGLEEERVEYKFVKFLFTAAADKEVNVETIKCLLDLGATCPTSIRYSWEKQVDTRRDVSQSFAPSRFGGAAYESTTTVQDVPVYQDFEETFYLLDVASSPEKKALLEAAIKKWEK